ncbi:hypothetical protein [Vibrio quintilis]|nr:hypothetical protein [Vibrio quintilis]
MKLAMRSYLKSMAVRIPKGKRISFLINCHFKGLLNMFTFSPKLLQLLQVLKKSSFENNIPYMYVDSVGKITVGVGHNLDAYKDKLELKFVVKRLTRHHVRGGDTGISVKDKTCLGKAATADQINNDYNFLTKHIGLKKYNPENLRKYTTLELSQDSIDKLFLADLKIAAAVAMREFGSENFRKYPIQCQAALIDIAFNVGNFSSFRNTFVPAIKGTGKYKNMSMSERWKIASQSCRRGQVSSERNNQVVKWLKKGSELCQKNVSEQ